MIPASAGARTAPGGLVSWVLASALDLGRSAFVPLGRLARTLRHVGGFGRPAPAARGVRGVVRGAPGLQRRSQYARGGQPRRRPPGCTRSFI